MTQTERKVIRAKLGLLDLATELDNVTRACRVPGWSRDSFYRFRDLGERGFEPALAGMTTAKPNLKNGVTPEVEAAAVERAVEQVTLGQGNTGVGSGQELVQQVIWDRRRFAARHTRAPSAAS
jgi:hypothetical protein